LFIWCSTIWKGATHPDGGTPNEQNSVYDTLPDNTTMEITSSNVLSDSVLEIVFSKQIDTLSVGQVAIQFVPELNWKTMLFNENSMQFIFQSALEKSKEFKIQLDEIQDCWTHKYSINTTFANSEIIDTNDIVINELLFNPYPDGADFIELYNTSEKWINLKDLTLFSLEKGQLSSPKVIEQNRIVKPHEYVFLTPSISSQEKIYPNTNKLHGIQMPIPTMNNDSGTVILMYNNQLIDKVSYKEAWHFPFLNNKEGKSLECLSAFLPSDEKQNWYTASENEGFATPGKANSHQMHGLDATDFKLSSPTISPDNDGFEDLVEISFSTTSPNTSASLTIYTMQGVEIKKIINNQLVSNSVNVSWDGLDNKKQQLPIGIYILHLETIELKTGKISAKKLAIVVAKNT